MFSATFCNTAENFSKDQNGESNHNTAQAPKTRRDKSFMSTLYMPAPSIDVIQAEIQHYLHEGPEPKGTKPLTYWATHQNQYPLLLSTMAHFFLAIPATSASSKCVFSKGCHIVSWK